MQEALKTGSPHDTAATAEHDRQLQADSRRNRELDRELARELGRPVPEAGVGRPGYLGRLAGRPRLAPERERELIERAQGGDREARAALVEAFLPLIASVVRPYRSSPTIQRTELLQEGVVGLLRALERYEPERGVPFWAYASWWVRQAAQQLVSELTRPIVLSDRALRQLARLKEAHAASLREHGREPGSQELAERTGLALDQVDDLIAVERAPRSLDEPVTGEEGAIGTFGDLLADPIAEDEYERVLASAQARELRDLLSDLSDRERAILRARYGIGGEEQSLREVGASLGVSAERVRQLEHRALAKLAAAAGVDEPEPA